jgi:hypothetical protein
MGVVALWAVSAALVLSCTVHSRSSAAYTSRWHSRVASLWVEGLVLAGIGLPVAVAAGASAWAPPFSRGVTMWMVVLSAVTAVVGGAPVATAVLRLADPTWPTSSSGLAHAGVLPAGEWLGPLERIVTFACLSLSWPEGVAAVLVLKSWGRLDVIKESPEAGQRFMIGTMTSVLWAAALAGVGWAART